MARYAVINVVLAVFAALVVLALAGVNIAAIIINSNQNSLQRFCVTFSGQPASNGSAIGAVSLLTNEREIEWDIQYMDLLGVVTGLAIHGPIPPGMSDGPLTVALCGLGTTFACDISTAGVLMDKIVQTGNGGPLKPIIQAIRKEPWRYLVKIKTSAIMSGEIQGPMDSLCGTPV